MNAISKRATKAANPEVVSKHAGKDVIVPFNLLFISESNVRKTRNLDGIAELAALIESQGLMHRLSIIEADEGRYGVIAGGRRFLAIESLVRVGKLSEAHGVECRQYESEQAVELSLAENSHQSMHPADQMEGFKQLIDKGLTVSQVAGRFGVTPLTVERRLKLARLSPRFLKMYRDDQIEPDQLMALALVDEPAAQEAAWDSLSSYGRSAHNLRNVLLDAELSVGDRLVKFVGLQAYEDAGGKVRRDLFATGPSDGVYLQDAALVRSLATAKLQAVADGMAGEGWLWIETSVDRVDLMQFGREWPKDRAMTEAEAAHIAELDATKLACSSAFNEHFDGDEDAAGYEETADRLERAHDEAVARLEEAGNALAQWQPGQLAVSGVMVTLTYAGDLEVVRGLIRPSDKKAAIEQKRQRGEAVSASLQKGVRAEHSEKLLKDLTSHRTAALQAAMTQNARVALVVLVDRLASSVFDSYSRDDGGVKVSLRVAYAIRQDASDFVDSPAAAILDAEEARWGARLPDSAAARFAWLMNQDDSLLLDLLAFCVGRSIDVVRSVVKTGRDQSDAIADALGVDMADWWTPTPAKYLGSVSKAKAIEAVTEATGVDLSKEVAGMKKAEAITYCAQKLEGTRWLPTPLRSAGA